MLHLKNSYPIGIDIADQNICAVQLQDNGPGIVVRELFHQKLNTGSTTSTEPDETMVPILKTIAKNKRFRGKSAAIHLPAQYICSFPLSFEVGTDETLEDVMVRECRRYLSFPLEEAVIDYPSIIDMSTGKNKRFKATIIAVHRSRIEQYMHLLKRAGLSLETIDFDLCCLLRLHNYLYAPKDDPFILCNVDYSQTLIAVVTQDRILAHHHVPWGIQPLLNRLESNLELSGDSEQTAGLLTTYGLYYEDCINLSENSIAKGNQKQDDATEIYRVVFQILSPYVDKLVHEFYKIIGYARSEMQQVKFEEISMYGQANSVNFLDQYLEKRLNIRTRCVNPMVKLALRNSSLPPDTSEGAAFAMALGLAMQKLRWL